MPFAYQPAQAADYGLESPHEATAARFRPVPMPNVTLSKGAQPNVDVEEPGPVPLPPPRFTSPRPSPQEVAYDLSFSDPLLRPYRGAKELFHGAQQALLPTADPGLKRTMGGATEAIKGAGDVATPVMIAGAIAQPELTVAALLGGTAGEYGGGKLADAVKASPEAKQLLEQVGGGVGAMVGGGVYAGARTAVDPTDALADLLWKRGYIEANGQPIHIQSQGEAMAVAKEIIKQNPQGFVNSIRRGYSWARAAENIPARQDMGIAEQWNPKLLTDGAPLTAPPQTPAPPPMHSITPEEIAEVGDRLAQLPLDQRPQATLAAHAALADILLQQGKFVGPDGKLQIISNQKQAESLAQKYINEEIGRQDAQAKKAANEPVPAPPAGFTLDETPQTAPAAAATTEESPRFAKGDRVVLPDGREGTIAHAHPRMNITRVVTDDRRASVDRSGQIESGWRARNGAGERCRTLDPSPNSRSRIAK